jgi:hypothetical protein
MSTSTRYPTTNAVGTTGFTNAGNGYASDDSYATAAPGTLNTISSYFGGFDFASYIPSGATINSVTVYCERKFSTTASNASSTLRPYNLTTALAAENENTSEPTSDTEYSVNFGALGVTDVRSADFRILVGAKRGSGATGYTYSLDVVYVTVDYTASASYSLTCDNGSVALTGQVAALNRGRYLYLGTNYTYLTLQDATLTYTPSGDYSLACTYAGFGLNGQAAALLTSRKLSCDQASFTLAGQTVTLTHATNYPLACDQGSFALTGQVISYLRALLLPGAYGSFKYEEQSAAFKLGHVLSADYAPYSHTGQVAALKAARMQAAVYGSIAYTGQAVTLTYTSPGAYTLEAAQASYSLAGQSLLFSFGHTLSCLYRSYALTGQTVQYFVDLWEPTGDMITFGTLLTRIQSALGDTSGATWSRTEVIWTFAIDAIRDFPILRPKTTAHTVGDAGHSFTLPSDFRKVIYVEFPPYQDPPEYLMRKSHLGTDFFGEDGFYDVDRDYDSGGDYILWTSNSLVTDDIVIVRYLATHTTEFANEYSYITIENQYVQVIINHVVLMCYQERLATQLQDPTAHTSTIQQMSDAVKTAEINYLDHLNRAQLDISNSQRIAGWKVDKHDRIY